MAMMTLQTNTPKEITQDVTVELVNLATQKVSKTKLNLDGSTNMRNLDPGQYRIKLIHPNLPFPISDKPIRVLAQRPTLIPIKVDLKIFENTPIRDIAEADLAPLQQAFTDAGERATGQANKKGGEAIFADDWNTLADTVGDLADSTLELTRRVTPTGHDHMELVEKVNEIQQNLGRFYEVFGQSMAQVQRQMQTLALKAQAEEVLAAVPTAPPSAKADIAKIIKGLEEVHNDNPYSYSLRYKRTGEQLQEKIHQILQDAPDVEPQGVVAELLDSSQAMAATSPSSSYQDEVKHHTAINKIGGGNFAKIVGAGRGF